MSEQHLIVLVEWNAPSMSIEEAQAVAEQSMSVLSSTPGLVDARFFGDFETGAHFFLLTWENRELMDRYMASEAMQSVRGSAGPFVVGAPTRRIFVDYGPDAASGKDS